MPIEAKASNEQISVSVGETQIDVAVSGGVGPTGSSGVVSVAAPLTNSGTSTAASIGLSVGSGLSVSSGSLVVTPGTYAAASHTHTASQITDFTTAVVAAAPPTTNASLLTSGTLPDARLSSNIARTIDISSAVASLVNSSPAALDTLGELAAALGNDASFATTVTNSLAAKAPINNPTFTGTVGGVTKAMVGLGNVQNVDATARANHTGTQAISTVTGLQDALDGKAATSHTHAASSIVSGTLDFPRLPFTVTYPVRAVHVGGVLQFNSGAFFTTPTYGQPGAAACDLGTLATMQYPATSVAVDVSANAAQYLTDNPGRALTYSSLEVALIDAANRIVGWGATASNPSLNAPNGTGGTSMTVSLLAFPTLSAAWVLGGGPTTGTNAADIAPITAYKLCQSRHLDLDRTDWANIPNKPTFATVATSGSAADLTGTLAAARLPASGVSTGTYTSVTVDTYGRVTAGSSPAVAYSSLSGVPSTFAPSAHTHGNITNDGKISGDNAGKILLTDANGFIIAADSFEFGSGVGQIHIDGLATVAYTGSYADLTGKPTIPAAYTLPTATGSVLGGVKIGSGISIDGNGVISASAGYTLPNATTTTLGGVIVGSGLSVSSGTVSLASHTHAASDITSGTIATARLGSGTASSSTFLRGDQTYAAAPVTSVDGSTGAVTVTKAEVLEFTRSSAPSGATGSSGAWGWSVPSAAKRITIECVGGGSGGGSGRRGATNEQRFGGGGGCGGGRAEVSLFTAMLTSLSLSIDVGAGGGGGSAVTADNTNGNPGSSGNTSAVYYSGGSFAAALCQARNAAGGGAAGTTAAGAGGSNFAMFPGSSGGASSTSAAGASGGEAANAPSGGGAGGGLDISNNARAGGSGGRISPYSGTAFGGSGGGATGGAGGNGPTYGWCGHGGGGGANPSGAGGTGGNGAFPGGGGGGGGASSNGSNSGAGGNGGDGIVRITVWY